MLSDEQEKFRNEINSRWDVLWDSFPPIIFHDWIDTYQALWEAIYGKTSLGLSKLSKCKFAIDWIMNYGVDDRDYIEIIKGKKIDLVEEYLTDAQKAIEEGDLISDHPDYPEEDDEAACREFEKNWAHTPSVYLLKRFLSQTDSLALLKQKNKPIKQYLNDYVEDDPAPSQKEIKKKEGLIDDVSGWVYVLREMETGLYKIGKTKDWEARKKQLKVDYKTIQLMQLKWVENRHLVESYHHKIYDAYRLPQTEWFKLSHQPII